MKYCRVHRWSAGFRFPISIWCFIAASITASITLLTKETFNDGRVQFSELRYRLMKTKEGYTAESTGDALRSRRFPAYIQPCRLNEDDSIDFAGGALDYTSSLALLTPIYTTVVQSSPNRTPQTFRTKSFTPHTLFTDMNQDGYLDLILERTDITDGGLRETLNRFMTQRRFSHRLSIHYQHPDGSFSAKADIQKTVDIKLDHTPIRLSEMFERYQAGKLINATGDFNHDGLNDLLVQVSPDTLAVFLCQGSTFSAKPDYTIPDRAL